MLTCMFAAEAIHALKVAFLFEQEFKPLTYSHSGT